MARWAAPRRGRAATRYGRRTAMAPGDDRLRPGDVILLYGTGFGPTNPTTDFSQTFSGAPPTVNTVTATIGGVPATVQFAGLVAPGEYQFNILVPGGLTGDNLVVMKVGGVSSQANAYLAVQ